MVLVNEKIPVLGLEIIVRMLEGETNSTLLVRWLFTPGIARVWEVRQILVTVQREKITDVGL